MNKLICFLGASLFFWPFLANAGPEKITFRFYSEHLSLSYDRSMLLPLPQKFNEEDLSNYYRRLEKTNFQVYLASLENKKEELLLNDWLFYDLMRQSLETLLTEQNKRQIELLSWFFLSKSGFDTRLTYLRDKIYVYVYSEDEIFETPMIQEEGRVFINLSCVGQKTKQEALYLLDFKPHGQGRSFQLPLKNLPRLAPDFKERSLTFNYRNHPYQLNIKADGTLAEIMTRYPLLAEEQYLETPFSSVLSESLIPAFDKWTQSLSPRESLELIVSFTRSAFAYKEDKQYFGRSKPMIADEVFLYPFSDCEDRTALFFGLVKSLLDLPMIILAFPDHLTVAAALPEGAGQPIRYKNRLYYVCDPTGPVNSSVIGSFPRGYENAAYEIIYEYK